MIYTKDMIKEKNEKKINRIKIIKLIFLLFFISIILLAIYVGYLKVIQKENNIGLFGYKQYVVLTGSMEPSYNVGDLVIDKQVKQEDIKVDDVISYVEERSGSTITHRVIEIIEQEDEVLYKTKGDHNDSPDANLVKYSQIQGKVIKKISGIGLFFINSFTTGTGIIIIFLIIIFNYIHLNKKEEKQKIREETRKKYNVPKYKEDEVI